MFSRKDYLGNKCSHREYYGQFVDEFTKVRVLNHINLERLKSSEDEHLNDIPLQTWDDIGINLTRVDCLREAGDSHSLAGAICINKEATRQILEGVE